MASNWEVVTVLSSITLRILCFCFLRWIPGTFSSLILASLLTYLISFTTASRQQSNFEIVSDEADIVAVDGSTKTSAFSSKDGTTSNLVDDSTGSENGPELDIKETITLGQRGPHVWRSLLLGLPSPTSALWRSITISSHLILAVFVADMIFRVPLFYPSKDLSFVRVGFVSDTEANLLIREPNKSQLPVFISYRESPDGESSHTNSKDSWKSAGKIYWLSEETDFTYAVRISYLQPSTRYQYAISNNQSGHFLTAPPVGECFPFTDKFTFLTSSCIKPRFPYSPLAHPLSFPGFKQLAKWIPSLHASFMLFLGDFIYIDVPLRLSSESDNYRREYRNVYDSPEWPPVSSIPWLHVLDDHEIANDWDKNTTPPYPAAVDPWHHYQTSVNPPAPPGISYFEFTQGLASFFLMDTRRWRTSEAVADAFSAEKSMLGADQLASLLTFLSRREPDGVKWKVVVSSVPFTKNWRINNADTWAGYLHERQTVLEAMWSVGTRGDGVGVVVLSGDRHEFAATAFPPPRNSHWPLSATVHEFSTSPLSMFYLPVRTYWEVEGEDDICIKYIPDGNSKFGAVEISNTAGGQSLLKFRLFVDGKEVWDHVILTPPAIAGGSRGKDALWG